MKHPQKITFLESAYSFHSLILPFDLQYRRAKKMIALIKERRFFISILAIKMILFLNNE